MAANGTSSVTAFDENVVPKAPEDPLFGLMAAYRKDTFEKKVDLGIGAYRDDNAKPWVLPVVKKVIDSRVDSKTFSRADKQHRPMLFSEVTPTSTTNTFPLPVYNSSPLPLRSWY